MLDELAGDVAPGARPRVAAAPACAGDGGATPDAPGVALAAAIADVGAVVGVIDPEDPCGDDVTGDGAAAGETLGVMTGRGA